MVFILLLLLPPLAVGLVLLVRGLHGRAIDDHPVCRRCRFDLIGLPASSTRCSECGADLTAPRATLHGNRRRRPGLILGGLALLIPGWVAIGVTIFVAASDIPWIQYAPHWYVLRQARNPSPAVHSPALLEFARRQAYSLLTDAQTASLLDACLALQADRSLTWDPLWGDQIESLGLAGKVPAEKWRQYLTNAPTLSLAVRPKVRRGDPLVVRILEGAARCATRSKVYLQVQTAVLPDSDLIKPRGAREAGSMGTTLQATGSGSFGQDFPLPPEAVAAAKDGPKNLHLQAIMDLFAGGAPQAPRIPDVTTTIDLRASWELVAADAPTLQAIDDPSQAAAVQASIKQVRLKLPKSRGGYVDVNLQLDRPPVPIAHRIVLRAPDGREWPLSGVYVQAGASTGWGTGGEAKGLDGVPRVDVYFRPDPKVALGTVDMTSYWNGEVVVRNVPVTPPDEPPQPTSHTMAAPTTRQGA